MSSRIDSLEKEIDRLATAVGFECWNQGFRKVTRTLRRKSWTP